MRFDDGYGFKIVPVVQLSFLFFADIGFPFFLVLFFPKMYPAL